MHRQLSSSDHREYVKQQYGRKIAQDTCMIASMKTPDWSQAPPGFIGKHTTVPCTVTTNSSGSALKMYPYSDSYRCQKIRSGHPRHRCFSGSAVQVLLPSTSQDALELRSVLLRPHPVEAGHRSRFLQPACASTLMGQSQQTKLCLPGRPMSGVYHHELARHSHHRHQHHLHPTSCLPNATPIGDRHLLSNFGFQPLSAAAAAATHRQCMLANPCILEPH